MMTTPNFVYIVADVTRIQSNVILVTQPQSNRSYFFLRFFLDDHIMLSGHFALRQIGGKSTGKQE